MNDAVRKQSTAVASMAEDWALIRALMGGTKAMRRLGKTYLPQWPAESTDSYKARLATATLFPAYARTISVLTGKPFSKPISIGDDVPPRIQAMLDNVDLQGRNLHSFAADVCSEALGYGLSGILVDYPKSEGVRTLADEKTSGVRPYFVHIHPESILGWRSEIVNGRRILTQLRLLESVDMLDGAFATKTIEQVRVLEPGVWHLWRKVRQDNKEIWSLFDEGATTLNYIPFVPVYGMRLDFMLATPPMLELAYANVEHWQSKSDQQTILHVARVPLLFAKAIGDAPMIAGAGALIKADSADADVKYVEHSGKAIESGRLSILDLEDRMRQTGAELLVIKPGNITEVQTLADNEQGMCDLQRIVQHLEDALDQALHIMGDWIGEPDAGRVTIYRDFGAATLAEASAQLLFDMQVAGSLTLETLLNELKRRGTISPDVHIDEEIAETETIRAKLQAAEKVAVVV